MQLIKLYNEIREVVKKVMGSTLIKIIIGAELNETLKTIRKFNKEFTLDGN